MKCPKCGTDMEIVVREVKERKFDSDDFDSLEEASFVDLDEYNCEASSEAYYQCGWCGEIIYGED